MRRPEAATGSPDGNRIHSKSVMPSGLNNSFRARLSSVSPVALCSSAAMMVAEPPL